MQSVFLIQKLIKEQFVEEKSIDKIKDDFILENKYLENIGYCIGNFDQPTGGHFIPETNDDEEEIIFIKSDNKDSNNEDIKTKLREKILQKSKIHKLSQKFYKEDAKISHKLVKIQFSRPNSTQ